MKDLVFNFLDSPPGSGKTTAIIRRVNECISKRSFEDDNKRFLIVTPYLSEVTVQIPLRRSRLSGTVRATNPDKREPLTFET